MISCSLFSAGLAGPRVRTLLEEPPESRISSAGRMEFMGWRAPTREHLVRGGSLRDQSRSRRAEGCGLQNLVGLRGNGRGVLGRISGANRLCPIAESVPWFTHRETTERDGTEKHFREEIPAGGGAESDVNCHAPPSRPIPP
jgi:hypothetical protein